MEGLTPTPQPAAIDRDLSQSQHDDIEQAYMRYDDHPQTATQALEQELTIPSTSLLDFVQDGLLSNNIMEMDDPFSYREGSKNKFLTVPLIDDIQEIFGSTERILTNDKLVKRIINNNDGHTVFLHNGIPFGKEDISRSEKMYSHKNKNSRTGSGKAGEGGRAILIKRSHVILDDKVKTYGSTLTDILKSSIVVSKLQETIAGIPEGELYVKCYFNNYGSSTLKCSLHVYKQLKERVKEYLKDNNVIFHIPHNYEIDIDVKQKLRILDNRNDHIDFYYNKKNIFENKPGYWLDPKFPFSKYIELDMKVYKYKTSHISVMTVTYSNTIRIKVDDKIILSCKWTAQDDLVKYTEKEWLKSLDIKKNEEYIEKTKPIWKSSIRMMSRYWTDTSAKNAGYSLSDEQKEYWKKTDVYYGSDSYKDGIYPYIEKNSLRHSPPDNPNPIPKYLDITKNRPGTKEGLHWYDGTKKIKYHEKQLFLVEIEEDKEIFHSDNTFFNKLAITSSTQIKKSTSSATSWMKVLPYQIRYIFLKYLYDRIEPEASISLSPLTQLHMEAVPIQQPEVLDHGGSGPGENSLHDVVVPEERSTQQHNPITLEIEHLVIDDNGGDGEDTKSQDDVSSDSQSIARRPAIPPELKHTLWLEQFGDKIDVRCCCTATMDPWTTNPSAIVGHITPYIHNQDRVPKKEDLFWQCHRCNGNSTRPILEEMEVRYGSDSQVYRNYKDEFDRLNKNY